MPGTPQAALCAGCRCRPMLIDGGAIPCPRCDAGKHSWRQYRYKGIPVCVCLICGFDGKRRRPGPADLQPNALKPVGFGAYRRSNALLNDAPAIK